MKRMILLLFCVVLLFAISAGSSWLLRHGSLLPASHSEGSEWVGTKGGHDKASELRPAVRSPFNPEAESTAQLANNLRNQAEALKTREQQLTARHKNLELIYQDLRTERSSLEELRKQCEQELKAVTEKLQSLERKAGEIDKQRKDVSGKIQDLNSSMIRVEDAEKANVKRLATVYDTMDAATAAQHLQHMADTGKIETAVKILAAMRERQASKILAEFPDKTTVSQLIEKMRSLDRSPASGKETP